MLTHALTFLAGIASGLLAVFIVREERRRRLDRMMDAAERAEEEQWRELNRLRDEARKETLRWN